MTYTSEEMIKAANEAIWNNPALTENEQTIARDFFYKGALWGSSVVESVRTRDNRNGTENIKPWVKE